jgi:hypothetical protein
LTSALFLGGCTAGRLLVEMPEELKDVADLGPSLQQGAELKAPMEEVAGLRGPMERVAGLEQPMVTVAGLQAPLTAAGGLRKPLEQLAGMEPALGRVPGMTPTLVRVAELQQPVAAVAALDAPMAKVAALDKQLIAVAGLGPMPGEVAVRFLTAQGETFAPSSERVTSAKISTTRRNASSGDPSGTWITISLFGRNNCSSTRPIALSGPSTMRTSNSGVHGPAIAYLLFRASSAASSSRSSTTAIPRWRPRRPIRRLA